MECRLTEIPSSGSGGHNFPHPPHRFLDLTRCTSLHRPVQSLVRIELQQSTKEVALDDFRDRIGVFLFLWEVPPVSTANELSGEQPTVSTSCFSEDKVGFSCRISCHDERAGFIAFDAVDQSEPAGEFPYGVVVISSRCGGNEERNRVSMAGRVSTLFLKPQRSN